MAMNKSLLECLNKNYVTRLMAMTVDERIADLSDKIALGLAARDMISVQPLQRLLDSIKGGTVAVAVEDISQGKADILYMFVDWLCSLQTQIGPFGKSHSAIPLVATLKDFCVQKKLGRPGVSVESQFLIARKSKEKVVETEVQDDPVESMASDVGDISDAVQEEPQSDGISGLPVTADEPILLADILGDDAMAPLQRAGMMTIADLQGYLGTSKRPKSRLCKIKGIGESRATDILKALADAGMLN